ncbi:hypothetical protein SLEP1_g19433 [Rubroshorea leprosula]|uniref:Uncharacterized protein n=1 Tax=Rubroshorea leprosula TaxID=152421 RepID=A0AAV5J9Y6_9ROSI|nr:hypothetical protein SLEP1_g19433 [Rubroshorea leprosula]
MICHGPRNQAKVAPVQMKFYDLSWSLESGKGSTRSYSIIKDLVCEVSS